MLMAGALGLAVNVGGAPLLDDNSLSVHAFTTAGNYVGDLAHEDGAGPAEGQRAWRRAKRTRAKQTQRAGRRVCSSSRAATSG